jgi:hypothetical protein
MRRIHYDINRLWHRYAKVYHVDVPTGVLFGELLDSAARDASREAEAHLQPWLAMWEQCCQWLSTLHMTLERRANGGAISAMDRAPVETIGAAATYANAIRTLVLSGYDHPARALLRSFVELIRLSVALLHDPDFRKLYRAAEDQESARHLWFRALKPAMIEQRLRRAELDMGIPLDVIAPFVGHRDYVGWLSGQVHPSFISTVLAARTPSAADPETMPLATIGACSVHSVVTLDLACKEVWYVATVGYHYLLQPYGSGFHHPDPKDPIDTYVTLGRDVVVQLVQRHWNRGPNLTERLHEEEARLSALEEDGA